MTEDSNLDGFINIPDVSGLSYKEAESVLLEAGLTPTKKRKLTDIPGSPIVNNNESITTNPAPGSKVPADAQVVVFVKLNKLLAITSALAALLVLAAIAAVLITILTPDNLVREPEPEKPKAPDESQAIKKGGSGNRVGGIFVAPTFFKEPVSVGSEIRPVEVKNNSPRTRKINFYFIPLAGNSPTGTPELKLTKDTLKEGQEYVTLNKKSATVKPGQSTEVRMKVIKDPGTPEYYGALLVELGRDDVSPYSEPIKNNVRIRVNNIFQIAAVRILQFGGQRKESGEVEQVRGFENEEEGGVGFTARVRNTGNVIAGPEGSVSVFDANGELIKRVPLEGSQGIIPGDYRETVLFDRETFKNLRPGAYTAQADVTMGGESSRARWQFEIDKNGKLPTPAMIAEAEAQPYRPGVNQDFDVNVEILNTGTATYSPRLNIRISPFGQGEVIERQKVEMGEVSPDGRVRETFSFKGIKEIGNYEFIAEVTSNDGTYLGQIVTSVLVNEEKAEDLSLYIKFRDWMSAHPFETMLIGGALLAVIVSLIFFLINFISKRRNNS